MARKKTIGEMMGDADLRVYILLDRSSSMGMRNLWGKTLEGINTYVRGLPAGTDITLVTFDLHNGFQYETVRSGVVISNWRNVTSEEIQPRGSTPLYDAAGKLYSYAIERGGSKVTFVVVTDGEENASTFYTQQQVKNLVKQAGEKGWETVFLGANFDRAEWQGTQMGVALDRSVRYTMNNTQQVFNDLSNRTRAYALGAGAQAFTYSDVEKANAVAPDITSTSGSTS